MVSGWTGLRPYDPSAAHLTFVTSSYSLLACCYSIGVGRAPSVAAPASGADSVSYVPDLYREAQSAAFVSHQHNLTADHLDCPH